MTKRKRTKKNLRADLNRIERKCDRILSELLVMRHSLACRPDMDTAIDMMHRAAGRLRRQCAKEYDACRRMFGKPRW